MSARTSLGYPALVFQVERTERGYLVIGPNEGGLSAWIEVREDGGIEQSILCVPIALRTVMMPRDDEEELGEGDA